MRSLFNTTSDTPFQNANTIEPILNDNKLQHDINAEFHPQNNHVNKIISHHNKTQNVTTNVKADDHNNTSIKPFRPSNKVETGDSKQLPSLIKDPKIITSPTEVNYHRKVTLKDANIDTNTKGQLEAMCKEYDYIFSKHMTDIGKTDLVQMSLKPKNNIKPLNLRTIYIAPKTSCMAKTRTNRFEKSKNNFPIYFELLQFWLL